jgi:hypothetical protein
MVFGEGGDCPPCGCDPPVACEDRLFGAVAIPTSLDIASDHATSWNNIGDPGGDTEYTNDVSGCGAIYVVDGTGVPGGTSVNGSGADCGTLQATGCGLEYSYLTTEENLCGDITTVDPPPASPGTWDVDFQFYVKIIIDEAGSLGTAGNVWIHVTRQVAMLFSPSGNAALTSCGLKDCGPYSGFDISALSETVPMYYSSVGGAVGIAVGDPAGDVLVSA